MTSTNVLVATNRNRANVESFVVYAARQTRVKLVANFCEKDLEKPNCENVLRAMLPVDINGVRSLDGISVNCDAWNRLSLRLAVAKDEVHTYAKRVIQNRLAKSKNPQRP